MVGEALTRDLPIARSHHHAINAVYPPASPHGVFAHLSATSSTFAPAGNVTGAGSNQRSSASLAFRTASSSVSPAEAHPGNSGKNAAQRLVWGSCSTTSRSFMGGKNNAPRLCRQTANERRAIVFIRVHSWLGKLRQALNEGTLRAFRNADRFATFKIFRRPGAL